MMLTLYKLYTIFTTKPFFGTNTNPPQTLPKDLRGTLPNSFQDIILIPNQTRPLQEENYTPIPLINIDAKIHNMLAN